MLRNKIVRFKEMYKSYCDHFLIEIIVFLISMKNAIKYLTIQIFKEL